MSVLTEKLDKLREMLQSEKFLNGDGLSNEVNIRIFCYDPKEEMTVQHFIRQLLTDQDLGCHLIECNLYQILLSICDEMVPLEDIIAMEEAEGSDALLEAMSSFATIHDYVREMQYSPHQKGDVLLLTGVGDVFPFMRVHALLEAVQPAFSDIPIVVMYPGTFDKRNLRLFDKLEPKGYYRAFSDI